MRKKHITWQWLSAAIISLLMVSAPALAGSLNPSAPPGPTMKTLDQAPAKDEVIPPWSQTLPASERFKLVLGGEAVLDRETGLVWEQAMSADMKNWYDAIRYCVNLYKGSRGGWRLPTVQEFLSLEDSSVSSAPFWWPAGLPIGHPFNAGGHLWSITQYAGNINLAWMVNVSGGYAYGNLKEYAFPVWCVRGGQGVDTQ